MNPFKPGDIAITSNLHWRHIDSWIFNYEGLVVEIRDIKEDLVSVAWSSDKTHYYHHLAFIKLSNGKLGKLLLNA